MELPPSLSPLPSKSWYSDNAGVEEVIGAGTVGVVKVLEDMSVNSCFNLVRYWIDTSKLFNHRVLRFCGIWGVGVLHRADIGGFPQMTIFHHFPPKSGGL